MTNFKDEYLKEAAVKPNSWAESLLHANKLEELKRELETEESGAKEKSTFDPMQGVKFVDQFGDVLPTTVEPTWVDQTKEGVTELKYEVTDPDGEKYRFNRKITVSKYQIKVSGIDDINLEYLG